MPPPCRPHGGRSEARRGGVSRPAVLPCRKRSEGRSDYLRRQEPPRGEPKAARGTTTRGQGRRSRAKRPLAPCGTIPEPAFDAPPCAYGRGRQRASADAFRGAWRRRATGGGKRRSPRRTAAAEPCAAAGRRSPQKRPSAGHQAFLRVFITAAYRRSFDAGKAAKQTKRARGGTPAPSTPGSSPCRERDALYASLFVGVSLFRPRVPVRSVHVCQVNCALVRDVVRREFRHEIEQVYAVS